MVKTDNIFEGLETCYDNNASDSLLVIKAGKGRHVLKYQTMMILNNKINHIIPLEIKYNNGDCYCYYNITSKVSLKAFLKRRTLKRVEFIGILYDLAVTAVNCPGYLLSSSNFLYNAEYMFVNPATIDVQLVYVPFEGERDASAAFREFVVDLILNQAVLEEDNNNFLQKILTFVRNELFTVSDFYLFLNKLKGTQKDEVTGKEDNVAAGKENGADEEGMAEKGNRNKKGLKNLFLAAAFISQIVLASVFFICRKYMKAPGNGRFTFYAALIMIAVSIDILIFKKLFSCGLFHRAASSEKAIEAVNSETAGAACFCVGSVGSDNDIGSLNTVMLTPDMIEQPYLLEKYGEQLTKIIIDKPEFIIGRLEKQVDYVLGNSAVGKIHARISLKNNSCYLADLNSINGTFINGIRIGSNKEYEIKTNDIIAFASSEYIFKSQPLTSKV